MPCRCLVPTREWRVKRYRAGSHVRLANLFAACAIRRPDLQQAASLLRAGEHGLTVNVVQHSARDHVCAELGHPVNGLFDGLHGPPVGAASGEYVRNGVADTPARRIVDVSVELLSRVVAEVVLRAGCRFLPCQSERHCDGGRAAVAAGDTVLVEHGPATWAFQWDEPFRHGFVPAQDSLTDRPHSGIGVFTVRSSVGGQLENPDWAGNLRSAVHNRNKNIYTSTTHLGTVLS